MSSLFRPTTLRQAIGALYEAVYSVRLGGPLDTAALLSISAAFLVSAPPVVNRFDRWAEMLDEASGASRLADVLAYAGPHLFSAGLAAIGGAWLAFVYSQEIRRASMLQSSMTFASSAQPMIPGSEPGMYVGLTSDKAEPIFVSDRNLMMHSLIIGQSGVGKTVAASNFMYQQIERGGGLLFIDPKVDYDNLQSIYNYCVWAGRQDDLLILSPGDPKNSNTYNPILFGDADTVTSQILGLLAATEGNASADYYKQAANSAVRAIVSGFQHIGIPYTMRDLALVLDSAAALDKLYQAVMDKGETTDVAIGMRLWIENFRRPFDPKSQAGVGSLDMAKIKQLLSGIAGRMQQFGTGSFGEVMNTYDPDVRLSEAIAKNKIVYVALPTMQKDVAALNFAKMLVADLRSCIGNLQQSSAARPVVPFQVFIDEAGSIMEAGPALRILLEQARSARIFFQLAVQNFGQFKAISDEMSETLPGNTVLKLIFRLASNDSPNELAELIGMRTKISRSISTTTSSSVSTEITQVGPGQMESDSTNTAYGERETEDFIIHPDTIRRLERGECIMLYEGDKIYNLRVPMLQFTPEIAAKIGKFRIARRPISQKVGLFDLTKDIRQFTSNAPLAFSGGGGGGGDGQQAAEKARAVKQAKAAPEANDPGAPMDEPIRMPGAGPTKTTT